MPSSQSPKLGKAAFNGLLDTNPVPMVWISNEIAHVAPAFLRRFVFLLEMKTPSRAVRCRIGEDELGSTVRCEAWPVAPGCWDRRPARRASSAPCGRR